MGEAALVILIVISTCFPSWALLAGTQLDRQIPRAGDDNGSAAGFFTDLLGGICWRSFRDPAPCTPADIGVLDDVVVCHSGCCSLTALDRFKEDTTEWRSTNPYKPGGSKYDEIEGRLLDLYRSGLSWAQKRSSNQQRTRPKVDGQHLHSAVDSVTFKSRIARSVVALLIYCSASAMTACHDRGGPTVVGHTPTPTIDSLIVSVEDVRRFAGLSDLKPDPKGDERQPYHGGSHPAGPCAVVSDEQAAFGGTWTQFRGVSYSSLQSPMPGFAKTLATVNQAVSIYPDAGTARDVFDKLVPQLEACSAMHVKYYDFTVTRPDPSTVMLSYTGHSKAATIYKVQSDYLILVSALAVPHPGQTARDVLENMTSRI